MLEKIDHIGIAVRDLKSSISLYRDVLGLKLKGIDTVESEQVKVAFFSLNGVMIELLEPLSRDSTIYRFIDRNGEGIHHIAIKVTELDKEIERLKSLDISLINIVPKKGAGNKDIVFVHPKSFNGVLLELCAVRE